MKHFQTVFRLILDKSQDNKNFMKDQMTSFRKPGISRNFFDLKPFS